MNKNLSAQIEQMHEGAKRAGRDPSSIGIECIIPADIDADRLQALEAMGVSHVAVVTMNQDLPDPGSHIDAISETRELLAKTFC
jgi:hypothetical protein